MHEIRQILNPGAGPPLLTLREFVGILSACQRSRVSGTLTAKDHCQFESQNLGRKTMAKYLQCSECGKLAFYYDDFVGTEKPFYRRFMRYPEGETKHEPPRCFSCGGVPRLIHENIKEEKAAATH
jgi:hypothetical protein